MQDDKTWNIKWITPLDNHFNLFAIKFEEFVPKSHVLKIVCIKTGTTVIKYITCFVGHIAAKMHALTISLLFLLGFTLMGVQAETSHEKLVKADAELKSKCYLWPKSMA